MRLPTSTKPLIMQKAGPVLVLILILSFFLLSQRQRAKPVAAVLPGTVPGVPGTWYLVPGTHKD